jgi:hypothetical protein
MLGSEVGESLADFEVNLPNDFLVTILVGEPEQDDKTFFHDQRDRVCGCENLGQIILIPLELCVKRSFVRDTNFVGRDKIFKMISVK